MSNVFLRSAAKAGDLEEKDRGAFVSRKLSPRSLFLRNRETETLLAFLTLCYNIYMGLFTSYIFAFLIAWLIGTILFWLVGRFSPSPPPIIVSAIGALIIEIFHFLFKPLPFLFFWAFYFLIAWIVMIKIAQIEKSYSFFAALFYIVIAQMIGFFLIVLL